MDSRRSSLGLITTIKESKEKTNSYATIGFTLVIIILLIVFAIRPTITKIVNIRKEIKEKDRISRLLDDRIQTLSALDNEFQESKEKFEFMPLVFPESERYVLLLSNIEPIVNRNSFKLSSLTFDKYDGESFNITTSVLKPTTVRITVLGLYSDFVNLLKDFESLPMYIVIDRVSFGNSRTSETNEVSFSLNLRIYNINEPKFYSLK